MTRTYRIWRSLDRPASFFGVKGRFKHVFLVMAAAGGLLSAVAWILTNALVGMVCLASICIGDYMAVIAMQGRLSDRALSRLMCSRSVPAFVHVRPLSIRSTVRGTWPCR